MIVIHKSDPDEKTLYISITGEVSFETRNAIYAAMNKIPQSLTHVVFNLDHVKAMDSHAIGTLLLLQTDLNLDGRTVSLSNVSPSIVNVFNAYGFDKLFTIEP